MKSALDQATHPANHQGKLVIAGIGIKLFSHITHEVKLAIETADKVFYISFHPFMDKYIVELNNNAESLNDLYQDKRNRSETYQLMSDKVVQAVIETQGNICMVFYGHPCVFALPGRLAIAALTKKNYTCVALPGISALDCIFADLLLDAMCGYVCLEATELVAHQRTIDTTKYHIIWQPYMYASYSTIANSVDESVFTELVNYLLQFYPANHPVIIYSAAMFPGEQHTAKTILLTALTKKHLSIESTLVICPEN